MWSPQYSAWRLLDEAWPKALIAVFRRRAKSIQVSDSRLSPRQRPPFVAVEAHELRNELGRLRGGFNFGAPQALLGSYVRGHDLLLAQPGANYRAVYKVVYSANSGF